MQSADEFTPSTTEPVFGSGLVSQTKISSSTNNETSDSDKVIPSSESVVNGQNDLTVNKPTSDENIPNGTTESTNGSDSSVVHVNGENEKPTVDDKPAEEVVPAAEKPDQVEPEPEPVSSTLAETGNTGSSTAMDTTPAPAVVEPTATTTEPTAATDNVPEVPVATASETPEVKSKSPRGKAAKAPAVSTTNATRQSTRGRKPASSSNVEENVSTDEPVESSSSQRNKRQAATNAKDAITASSLPTSTDEIDKQDAVPSATADVVGDDVGTESPTKGTPGRKRGAPKSTPTSAKKGRGKTSLTSTDDVDNETAPIEAEPSATPTKKARTSVTKKTPEPPSEEYARKLRPRK